MVPDFAALIHMGQLAVERPGRPRDFRHFAMYPTSLHYWLTAEDMAQGVPSRGRIVHSDLTGFEVKGSGFRLMLKDQSTVMLIPDPDEMKMWESAWEQVELPCRSPKPTVSSARPSSEPLETTGKEQVVPSMPAGPSSASAKELGQQSYEMRNAESESRTSSPMRRSVSFTEEPDVVANTFASIAAK